MFAEALMRAYPLLPHSEKIYRQLAPMLGDLKADALKTIVSRYIQAFMETMTKKVSRGLSSEAVKQCDSRLGIRRVRARRRVGYVLHAIGCLHGEGADNVSFDSGL